MDDVYTPTLLAASRARLRPPSMARLALEQMAWWELGTFWAASPWLTLLEEGDGHPVLVLPGFTASDTHTSLLRIVLRNKGYRVYGWDLGANVGPTPRIIAGGGRRLALIERRHREPVSLIGWSLGGIYARELARERPEAVRQVITLASPFRFREGDRGLGSRLYNALAPPVDPFPGHAVDEDDRPPVPVPSTSIYTRTDGVVRWHACIDRTGPNHENIEVRGTHSGLPVNLAVLYAVTNRLAQPADEWQPFRAPLAVRQLFPRPRSWQAPAA